MKYTALGRFAAWTAFILNQAYAVNSGLGFLSLKSPTDAIRDPYLSMMAVLIVLMAPFMVVTMLAVVDYAPRERKSLGLAALAFMIVLAGITSSVNFALLVANRLAVTNSPDWLSLFLPYKWPALAYVMDIFAWDWFFALSMLSAAVIFRKDKLETAVRFFMIASGSLCLVGLFWLLISPSQAILIGMLGWGVAGPIVFLLLAILFGRIQPEPEPLPAA